MVSCHLGNGSSLAAIDGGKCVDTSMGLTPLAGLPMGTRAGDMDVGVVEFIANKYDMTISEAAEPAEQEVRHAGSCPACPPTSGIWSRRRRRTITGPPWRWRFSSTGVRKMIAEYAAAMGGVDVVVFTAGVGENSAETRAHILQGLEFMGITCDPEKNRMPGRGADHLPGRRPRHRDGGPHQRGADDRPGHHGTGPGPGISPIY